MINFTVYTDGSSSPKKAHRIGGWGYVAIKGDYQVKDCGYEVDTTNQRMEMLAIIKGLEFIRTLASSNIKISVSVFSDSRYCIDGITQWCHSWRSNGWKKSGGPIKNLDLWKRLFDITHKQNLECNFNWVKGHSGDYFNEMADQLANEGKQEGICNEGKTFEG